MTQTCQSMLQLAKLTMQTYNALVFVWQRRKQDMAETHAGKLSVVIELTIATASAHATYATPITATKRQLCAIDVGR